MIVIGADIHKSTHALAAVNGATGEIAGENEIRAGEAGHLVDLCPHLEVSIPARQLDTGVMLDRIVRRLRREPRTARVRVALELVASIRAISRQADVLERELRTLITAYRPGLLAEQGCGTLTAATLIGRIAGAECFPTDAHFARQVGVAPIPVSSGRKDRHRLHRGGDRQLNRALHVIAITRARIDPDTRAYLDRKRSEGKTNREALRCLKRHLARRIHRLLSTPNTNHDRETRITQNTAISVPCLT